MSTLDWQGVSNRVTANVQGLLLRWHSMNFSPERQPPDNYRDKPKAEDKTKVEQ